MWEHGYSTATGKTYTVANEPENSRMRTLHLVMTQGDSGMFAHPQGHSWQTIERAYVSGGHVYLELGNGAHLVST